MPMPPYPPAQPTQTWSFSYGCGGSSTKIGASRNTGLWPTTGTFYIPTDPNFWNLSLCDYTSHIDSSYTSSLAPWTVTLESFPFAGKALLSFNWDPSSYPHNTLETVALPADPLTVQTADEVLTALGIFGLPDYYHVTFLGALQASSTDTELTTPYGTAGPAANPSLTSDLGVLLYGALPTVPVSATAQLWTGDGGSGFTATYDLRFNVVATRVAWWWTLPAVDSCGNPNPKAPLINTPDDPSAATGYQWQKLDPSDHTAHPTPVITALEPNHGPAAGGTTVTIRGSGFGTEATVTLDGTAIASADTTIVDEQTITFITPGHAAGDVNIVVTNVDGVSSS
jgi:hypothetical protein